MKKKNPKSGLPGMTQAQARAAHKATRTREIELVRSTARKMISEGQHKYVWFQLIMERLKEEGRINHDLNQRYGGHTLKGDGWVQIGIVWVGNRGRGTNTSYRGVWYPATGTEFIAKPASDILIQGTEDLRDGRSRTNDAKIVLLWLHTEIEMQELNRRVRLR